MFYTPYNLLCVANPILLAAIIDGSCDLAKVNLAERPRFLSPRRLREHTHTKREISCFIKKINLVKVSIECFRDLGIENKLQ